MKKLLFTLLFTLILTGCNSNATTQNDSTATANPNGDSSILNSAETFTIASGFTDKDLNPFVDGSRYFEVRRNSENEFSVDVNGTEMIIQTPSSSQPSGYQPLNKSDLTDQYKEIIISSKELVYEYIDESTILKDKDNLKEYISSLSVQEATFTDDKNIGAFFSPEDNTLYFNIDNTNHICEWIIVHELIHALAYYTHDCNMDNEEYPYNRFNEVLTEIITSSLNPEFNNSIQSGYLKYFSLIYPYINLLGEDALEAYYYGYDNIYEKISKDELDFFVVVLENYGAENSDVYYNNLILKWYAVAQ